MHFVLFATRALFSIDYSSMKRHHQQIAAIDHELAEWARCNTTPAPALLGGIAPEELARQVVAGAVSHLNVARPQAVVQGGAVERLLPS